ncbi:tail assembly chaperone [Fructobacillus fructosus]|uniref:tail assembly chaperone n=1 Tax=Fructobacillus fructosus TaxID=1631 RepID=UPI002DAFE1A9|nr:hypothetical protein LMG30235_GOPAMIKF_00676 [Fructobacillus fructosus]CAK1236396.1 hypothetical protein R54866_LGPIEIPA_00677 [Fructobacillus fructosus]CAK1237686.1 hypothetical protein LMG30234_GAICNKDF_00737 [Fructobacillus fructosus]
MEYTVNGKTEEFAFDMKFIREMDRMHKISRFGMDMAVGLQTSLNAFLNMDSLTALSDILLGANHAAGGKLKTSDIDAFFEDENTDLDAVWEEVAKTLEEGKFTKRRVAKMQAEQAAQLAAQKAMMEEN